MSMIKIDKRITKDRVRKPDEKPVETKAAEPVEVMAKGKDGKSAKVIRLTEEIQRPDMLIGSTYKIKTPVSDHAMYVTINDIERELHKEPGLRKVLADVQRAQHEALEALAAALPRYRPIAAAAGHSMPVPQPGPRVGSATVPL